jgi:hypothetical protein
MRTALALLALAGAGLAQGAQPRSDFVFIVDDSQSMGAEIANIRTALPAFVQDLQHNNVDHRFAVVAFGDAPRLLVNLTADVASVQAALASLRTPVRQREAGLEAIRMVLGEAPVGFSEGAIAFRPQALKNLILITDEDSDQPHHLPNQMPGQTQRQPPRPLTAPWQLEIDVTAAAVLKHRALLNQMIMTGDGQTIFQYGAWVYTRLDSRGRFDRAATLLALRNGGLGRCLQAQILAAEGLCRSFRIEDMRTGGTFVRDFFNTKLQETLCPCPHDASVSSYGQGWPGSNGIPSLAVSTAPSICSRVDLVVGNSLGSTTPACVLFSDARADAATRFGGRQLVDDRSGAFVEVAVFVGAAGTSFPMQVPCNLLELCGKSYYLQSVVLDAGASHGVAFSLGLELKIGN